MTDHATLLAKQMQELRQSSSEAPILPPTSSGTLVPGASPTGSAANSSDDNAQGKFAPQAFITSPASFTYGVSSSAHSSLESTQPSTKTLNVSATGMLDTQTVASTQTTVLSSAIHATSVPSNSSFNQSTIPAPIRPLNCPPFPLSASHGIAAASVAPSASPLGPFTVVDSSASRPSTPGAPLLSNPMVHQHAYPPFHSVPSVGASPQAVWLQPPQMGAFARPPFLPYAPPAYPVPFPLAAPGMPLPSVPVPDSQPPGVTPVGNLGFIPISSSAASVNQMATGSATQKEVQIPGSDGNKGSSDVSNVERVASSDKEEAWSAHRAETGAVYYYNAVTGESTYQKPIGFKGELDKVIAQPTPVSWEKLAGTDWSLVTTNDGKNYYYNTKTKTSSWHVPTQLAELRKKKSEIHEDNPVPVQNTNELNEKGSGMSGLSAPALTNGGRDSTTLRMPAMPGSSALDLVKKKLQESGAPMTSVIPASGPGNLDANGSKTVEAAVKGFQGESTKDKPKETDGNGNMSDSSSDSEDSDSGPTMEERVIQFKEMLKERGVAPFSKWEKELPKIVFDPRFKAIPSYAERRSLFEHYVRTRAEEERKEKRATQKAAIEGFKQLLEEAKKDINENTNYQTFKKKWGRDVRFEVPDRKEREHLLNERIVQLKRAAEEKVRAVRAAAASGFKSLLREKGDITASSRWSRVKEGLRDDPRYKAVKHEEREALFNEYISELKSVGDEAERAGKAEQDKLKEREKELRKRKEREEQEMERVRVKIRRKEAVESFQALLVETIRDPQVSWTESKPKLEKDPQRRATNPELEESDLEKLFREHIKMLHERCINKFRALLDEAITMEASAEKTEDGKTVLTSWSTAKQLLKSDHRYKKLSGKERESLWRRHAEEVQRKEKDGKNSDLKSKTSVDPWRPSRSVHERRNSRYPDYTED